METKKNASTLLLPLETATAVFSCFSLSTAAQQRIVELSKLLLARGRGRGRGKGEGKGGGGGGSAVKLFQIENIKKMTQSSSMPHNPLFCFTTIQYC
jgi:hypothetical protein